MKTQRLQPSTEPAPRIVVADANEDTRLLYGEALRNLNVDVVFASDGREALVQCFIQKPDLVITETRLPFVDGYSLCELLRRDTLTRAMPIIVVTADVHASELMALRRLGAISILSKPVSVDVLTQEVARVRDEPCTPEDPRHDEGRGAEAFPRTLRQSIATRSFRRFETTEPATLPPLLRCPDCDRLLEFRKSCIGGVTRRNAEQWDEFCCPDCNQGFEYRHRTKKLRSISTN